MATGSVLLPIAAAVTPDGTSGNEGPAIQRVKSSSAAPAPFFLQAAFDAGTSERIMWAFRMPADYFGTPVLKIQYKMASATSGNIRWSCRVAAVTPSVDTTDLDAKTFASPVEVTSAAPGSPAGRLGEVSVPMTTNDSLAANDYAVVYIARFANDAADTATGDCEVVAVTLEYQTS